MKKYLVKALTLVLALSLAAAMLAACGGGTTASSQGASSGSAAAGSSGAASPEDTITLTFGIHVADLKAQEPQVYEVLQGFMAANPDVKIEILATSDADEQSTQMKLAAESGTLPDVFWLQPGPAKEMFEAGYLLDLSGFLDSDQAVDAAIGESLRSMNEDGTVNTTGAVFGLPYQKLVTGFWLNTELFEQYGLDIPHSGTTFEELLDMVEVFNANGVTTISNGAKTPYSIWAFQSAWVRYGFLDHINGIREGTDSFVNDDFINYFEMIDQLRVAGAFPSNITTQDYFQAKDAFLAGNAAMLDAGQWDSTEVAEAFGEKSGFWWGPTFANGVGDQQVGMQAFTSNVRVSAKVADDAAKQEAVYRFLSYWLSEEADIIRISYGTNPLVSSPDAAVDNPAYAAMLSAMGDDGWSGIPLQPDQIVPENVQSAMHDAVYGVMSGIYTPQEACDTIQAAQDRV